MQRFVKAASYVFVRPGIPIPPAVVFHEADRSDEPNLGLNENSAAMHTPTSNSKVHEMTTLRVSETISKLDTAMQ